MVVGQQPVPVFLRGKRAVPARHEGTFPIYTTQPPSQSTDAIIDPRICVERDIDGTTLHSDKDICITFGTALLLLALHATGPIRKMRQ